MRAPLTLEVEAIRKLTRYCHWIPACNGITQKMMEELYPGWDWNDLVPRMIRRGILVRQGMNPEVVGLFFGITISKYVEAVRFTDTRSGVRVKVVTSAG